MNTFSRRLSVAPMMDYTDRHARYFLRLVAPKALLYTEMVTTGAILNGDRDYLLGFNPEEHPLALQLGGSDPAALAICAEIGEGYGYDEINLNVGCPSPRVSKGRFGACLMLEPTLVADCIAAMRARVKIPVTVKCRIGVDAVDDYAALCQFLNLNVAAGCDTFIIHARKAWLKGLSPKQNREVPPLRYDIVQQLKKDFPALTIIVNGGISTHDAALSHLSWADGVMIGRAAFSNPYLLAQLHTEIFPETDILSRQDIVRGFIPYVEKELKNGVKLTSMIRHILGIFQGLPGAAHWRRTLSQKAHLNQADVNVIREALV